MKVSIKYDQVEIALQALLCSVEKVVFGTASLKDTIVLLAASLSWLGREN